MFFKVRHHVITLGALRIAPLTDMLKLSRCVSAAPSGLLPKPVQTHTLAQRRETGQKMLYRFLITANMPKHLRSQGQGCTHLCGRPHSSCPSAMEPNNKSPASTLQGADLPVSTTEVGQPPAQFTRCCTFAGPVSFIAKSLVVSKTAGQGRLGF